MKSIKISGLVTIGILASIAVSCGANDAGNNEGIPADNSDETAMMNEGELLMEQNCFACHFKTPDPAKKSEMIAPPMLRVQEHYKPVYPDKTEFVAAVMDMVNDPTEEKSLMPGALRKFNLMPKAAYDQSELKLIAEALFDMDFGATPNHHMQSSSLSLNDGEKWKLKASSIELINTTADQINTFESDKVEDYNEFGKTIFSDVKTVMSDKDYTGELFDQIHVFFGGVEGSMHELMSVKSIDEANVQLSDLKVKFTEFNTFFEAD
ncbi:MAG: hypothetical protein GQ574_15375 [Crocinitomix sp.]|nr:hypothetical protein [Crocinitomix sp.]